MIIYNQNPWETTSRSDLVSTGTHKLYVSTSGKPRTPGSPVVIFFTGGGSPIAAHLRLQSLLSAFARVYFYDRSGYDLSEPRPSTHSTAAVAAEELTALLKAIHVAPPYVLVAHSCGCIVARSFLALHSSNGDVIAGMVLVDAATELLYELYPAVPASDLAAVAAGVDWAKLTHLKEESRLSDKEWEAAIRATERSEAAADAEDCRGSGRALAKKRQFEFHALGDRPLSVVRCNSASDYRIMYEAGVRAGNGSEEQRAGARKFIETWDLFDDELRAAQLRLSKRNRYRHVRDCGHDISIRRPEVIAEEVQWVLEELRA